MDRLSVMHMPDVLRTGEHDAEPEEVWGQIYKNIKLPSV